MDSRTGSKGLAGNAQRKLVAAMVAMWSFAACNPTPDVRVIETPDDVLALEQDVVAFQMEGTSGQTYLRSLPVTQLGPEARNADSLLLLRYTEGEVTEVARLEAGEGVLANLSGGQDYLLYAIPSGFLRRTYDGLCKIQENRDVIEQAKPGLYDRLCPLILCSANPVSFDRSAGRFEGNASLTGAFDFGPGPIGGFGPGSICDQCTGSIPLVMPTLSCGGGTPATSTCENSLFEDDFEADAISTTPSTAPPPDPPTDMLILQESPGDITVIASIPLGSKAVEINRGSGDTLAAQPQGAPHTSGRFRLQWKAYSGIQDTNTPSITIGAVDTKGETAFRVIFYDGNLGVATGGPPQAAGSYTTHAPQEFSVDLDLDAGKVSIEIDGSAVVTNQPLLSSSFANLNQLRFEHVPAILVGFPATLVVDDIQVCQL